MQRDFFIFSNGRLSRKDNTLFFENEEGEKKAIPLETVRNLYLMGENDFNTQFLNYIAQYDILLHVFNYYGYYSGTFTPRESLLSGHVIIKQAKIFTAPSKQIILAKETICAAAANIMKNLKYYNNREKELSEFIIEIEKLQPKIAETTEVDELMGIEGNIRNVYYKAFNVIINQEINFEKRVKRPPDNMINTLISYGNSMLYTTVLSEIYKTQLNPTISFLHKPGYRRFSLALDIAEIFKPILVDRIIFRVLNKNMIDEADFEKDLNFCYMKEKAKKVFIKEYDTQLQQTIKHKKLDRNFSYRYLIRLECYKLIKFLVENKPYEAFRIWW
ncbi:MAG: type I-B CRISPR-associated endonuclease Cas1b [Candidatus Cloacimonetes bacterium]|nr:type I-B CRISPR-associated endonuclease Cas1b [Candidatus Cloacimonadota bacterium]